MLIAVVMVIAGGVALYGTMLLIASRRGRCPSCDKRALQMDPHASVLGTGSKDGERFPYSISAYRCLACDVEWRSYNGGASSPSKPSTPGPRSRPRSRGNRRCEDRPCSIARSSGMIVT